MEPSIARRAFSDHLRRKSEGDHRFAAALGLIAELAEEVEDLRAEVQALRNPELPPEVSRRVRAIMIRNRRGRSA